MNLKVVSTSLHRYWWICSVSWHGGCMNSIRLYQVTVSGEVVTPKSNLLLTLLTLFLSVHKSVALC